MVPTFLKFSDLPSTHEYAIDLLSKTTPAEATVILAAHQSSGKGRYDREWNSEPNQNLLLSLILYPRHIHVDNVYQLNIITSLAVVDLLSKHGINNSKVKWPNDIMINQLKISGILVHNQLSKMNIASSVVSVGLNVNQLLWKERINATSMKLASNRHIDIDKLSRDFVLDSFIKYYNQSMSNTGKAEIQTAWKNVLYGFQQELTFQKQNGDVFKATLIDVTLSGKVLLKFDGIIQEMFMDEVRLLTPP